MMDRKSLAHFLTGFMRAADFAVRAVDERHGWVIDWLPYAAAHGYLHAAVEDGEVRGLSIAGPITSARLLAERRPQYLRPSDFEAGGDVLLGLYLFVDPRHRADGRGMAALDQMRASAQSAFPGCETYAYWRDKRGLTVRPMETGVTNGIE